MSSRSILPIGISILCAGCCPVTKTNDLTVQSLVEERIKKPVRWYQGVDAEEEIVTFIDRLLQKELDLDACVQIALFNNQSIQATFEELGMKQADLVQAGLFQNPLFQGFVRFPDHKSLATNSEFSITQSFLEFFLIPLRKKFAETALRQAELKVAHSALHVTFDVREAFYTLQADERHFVLHTQLIEEKKAAYMLAKGQYAAGNINKPELQRRASDYVAATLETTSIKNRITAGYKKLAMLLGLRNSLPRISTNIPHPSKDIFTEETLFTKASAERLDLISARLELKRIIEIGATKKWWAYTDASIGISGEKEPEGSFVLGPLISLNLPLFNHGQADRARLLAELKASKHRLKSLEVDLRAEVKAIIEELHINRLRITTLQETLLPLKKAEVATLQKYYNQMGVSVYKLLDAKREEIQAEIDHTMALKDYLVSRVQLDRIIGSEIR